MEFIGTCTWCDFLDAVQLLLCSSFSFLDKLLTMSLLRYLHPVPKADGLPNPQGSLSKDIPSTAISSANEQVTAARQGQLRTRKRGQYHQLSPGDRTRRGRYACENGVVAAARRFSQGMDRPLNESTVWGIKRAYLAEASKKREPRKMSTSANCQPRNTGDPCFLEAASTVQYRIIYKRYASVGELSIHPLLLQVLRAYF